MQDWPIETWTTFWGWLLVIVLGVFSLLTLAIAIGGFFDIKSLLSDIDNEPTEFDDANGTSQ